MVFIKSPHFLYRLFSLHTTTIHTMSQCMYFPGDYLLLVETVQEREYLSLILQYLVGIYGHMLQIKTLTTQQNKFEYSILGLISTLIMIVSYPVIEQYHNIHQCTESV